MDYVQGEVLYVVKPLGYTSFNIVNKLRWELKKALQVKKLKVGHAGTLDPCATGVLIVCTGGATKKIDTFQYQTKEYIATIQLGATTPSFDLELPINEVFPIEHITTTMVQGVVREFVGEIWQVPPIYSAVKVQGKRAYNYAREGQAVTLSPKLLVIDEIEVLDCTIPNLKIRVVCSKGTYMRALARDIGIALGSGAHLTALQRVRIGNVWLENCWKMEDLVQHIRTTVPVTQQ